MFQGITGRLNQWTKKVCIPGITLLLTVTGQSHAASPEEEIFADIPEVLTATRLRQPVNEAPASMTIIDRHMIEAIGARNIADVFRIVPGFMVQHENGHTPIVTYHGMSDQYSRWMQVLVDGRSVYTPAWGGVEWSQLPLVIDEIERIEVTRGPNAASFGSNAFAATINIITKHSSDTDGAFFRFTAGEPNELRDAVLQYGDKVDITRGNLDYRLTLGRLTDDGFEDRHDLMEANLARFRLDYNNGGNDTWLLETGFNNGPRGLDGGNNYDNPDRNFENEVKYQFQQLRWTHKLDNNEEFYVQYFHNYHQTDETRKFFITAEEFFSAWPPPPAPQPGPVEIAAYNADPAQYALYNTFKVRRHDLEAQHTKVVNDRFRLAWGGSIRRDTWQAPGLIAEQDTTEVDLYRLFANSEWSASENLKVNLGAMAEDSELTGTSLSPRLGLVYKFNQDQSARAVISKAVRIPSMIEYDGEISEEYSGQSLNTFYNFPTVVYDSYLLNPDDLDHETITSFEIGLNSHHRKLDATSDIKLFANRVNDIIYIAEVPEPPGDLPVRTESFVVKNGGEATIAGLELQVDMKPYPGNRIFFSYTYLDIVSHNTPADYQDTDYANTAPEHSISLLLSQQFGNQLNASLILNRTGEYEGLGTGNKGAYIRRADMRLATPYRTGGIYGDIALVAQNIFSVEQYDWDEENHMKRRVMMTITGKID